MPGIFCFSCRVFFFFFPKVPFLFVCACLIIQEVNISFSFLFHPLWFCSFGASSQCLFWGLILLEEKIWRACLFLLSFSLHMLNPKMLHRRQFFFLFFFPSFLSNVSSSTVFCRFQSAQESYAICFFLSLFWNNSRSSSNIHNIYYKYR